jgi:hypothetical protein
MTQGLCEGPEVGGGVVGQADGGGWVLRGGDQVRGGGCRGCRERKGWERRLLVKC